MKGAKLGQIARIREQVKHLRTSEHLSVCDCCQADLDLIETDADSPCALLWLRQVARRVQLSMEDPSWNISRGPGQRK